MHYGEEQSRLSREISIVANEGQEIQWTKPLISILSPRAADQYIDSLETLFVDEFIYGHAWDAFMTSCMKGWQKSFSLSPLLAYIWGSLACLSLLTSVLLIHRHKKLDLPQLMAILKRLSQSMGMQGAAFAYALPEAFFLYCIIAFLSQWASPNIVCQYIYLPHASFCIGAIFITLIAFQHTTSHNQLPRPTFSTQWFRSVKEEETMV